MAQVEELRVAHAPCERLVTELRKELGARDDEISALNGMFTDRDGKIGALQQQVQELQAQHKPCISGIEARDIEISKLNANVCNMMETQRDLSDRIAMLQNISIPQVGKAELCRGLARRTITIFHINRAGGRWRREGGRKVLGRKELATLERKLKLPLLCGST